MQNKGIEKIIEIKYLLLSISLNIVSRRTHIEPLNSAKDGNKCK